MTRLLNRIRARSAGFDTAMTVHERVGAVGGGPLASSIAMATFLSLFPLMLVGIAVMGFLAAGDDEFARHTVENLGVEGKAGDQLLEAINTAKGSRQAASVVGLVGFLWSGLGVVAAVEGALNHIWQVQGRGITGKILQLLWLLGAGGLLITSMAIGPLLNFLPGPAFVPSMLVGFGLDVVLLIWTFHELTNAPVPWRAHLPGALIGAVGFGILKLVGGFYVPRLVASSSALYGSIGIIFALLAWLMIGARLLIYAATFNVVRYERGHGTVTVELQVPHIGGQVPTEATRGGAVDSSTLKESA